MAKYLTLDGLTRFWGGVKAKLDKKVDVVEGYSLTKNDLTDELKAKYDAAQANVLEAVSVNGEALTITEKGVDVTVPTKVSDLDNDSSFATTTEVATGYYNKTEIDDQVTTINEAIAAAASGKMTRKIVDAVNKETGMVTVDGTETAAEENVLYFVLNGASEEANVYDEYMLISGKLELMGTTKVDLSGYVKSEDIVVVTDEEIDAVLAAE